MCPWPCAQWKLKRLGLVATPTLVSPRRQKDQLPRKALTLQDTVEVNAARIAEILSEALEPHIVEDLAPALIRRARMEQEGRAVRHRAQQDSEAERQVWLAVGRLAEAERFRSRG